MGFKGLAATCVGLVSCVLAGGSAQASELLLNGDFAEGVGFWNPLAFGGSPAPTLVFSLLDRGGSDESGSGQVTQSAPAGTFGDVAQCVPIVDDEVGFDLAGWVLISPDNPNDMATAGFRVAWYPTTNCSGGGSSVESPKTSMQDQWIQLARDQLMPPAGTQSARVLLEIRLEVQGQPITVNYDDVEFLPEPSSAAALGASVLTLVGVGRRRRRA